MITDIRLQHFRSYEDESFEFGPGVNIIVGPNASGKTNLLESIMVVSTGGSYRVRDADLIAFGSDWSRLDAHTEHELRTVKIEPPAGLQSVKKTFVIDDQEYKRLSLQKSIPVVLFEPNHLLMLTGGPELRRNFIDTLLEQTTPGYATLLRQYRRILAQRNVLLKKGRPAASTQLFAWNIRLSEVGAQVALKRSELVQELATSLQDLYRKLTHTDAGVTVAYQSSCKSDRYASDMLHKLERNMDQEFMVGHTLVGPHRDDMIVELNKHELSNAASRGETRTMLLALKIIEVEIIERAREQSAILLLDDVFSELDGARRKALTEYLVSRQTFITTTDADVVIQHFMDNCTVIPIVING